MNALMGVFLLLLAALKFFDLKGFADAFAGYDPLARRLKIYAFAYPFIELALALMFLAGALPVFSNLLLIIVFSVTTLGVIRVIQSGETVKCGCAGAGFNLPVGKVTVAENLAMIIMGIINLLSY